MYSEEGLVLNLILKNTNAITFAYQKYGPALYGTIRIHATADVDLIFIATCTRIFNTIDEYDSTKCRFFTWMYRIMMDEVKKSKNEPEPLTN